MSTPPNPRHHGNGAPSHLPGRNGTGDTGGGPSRRSPLKGTARDGAPVRAHTANLEDDSLSLTAETIEQLAHRVADLLEERALAPTSRLLTATELARALGVTRSYVYDHAHTLGAIRTGTGTKPRLRFDLDRARAAWNTEPTRPTPTPPTAAPRRRQPPTSRPDLLPIRGQEAA